MVNYTTEDKSSTSEIIEKEDGCFIDMWVNEDNECDMLVLTIFPKKN